MKNKTWKVINAFAERGGDGLEEYVKKLNSTDSSEILEDIFKTYMNDVNSSTLREYVTLKKAGFEELPGKLGYDGHKFDKNGKEIFAEVKPKNITENTSTKKLNGGGNYTDITFKKFERFKNENPTMLLSGFYSGKLLYVISFTFNSSVGYLSKIEEALKKRFPNGDVNGQYLRSAQFSYLHYKDSDDIKAEFVAEDIEKFEKYIVKDLYDFLIKNKGK